MNRAMAVLTLGAVVTLVVETSTGLHPGWSLMIASVFALVSIGGFRWVDALSGRRRQFWASGFVVVLFLLGMVLFSVASAGVGATLLLMVLVSQSVRLLPLPAAALVTAVVPLVHVGMPWSEGLREGLGTFAAAAFTAVVTELVLREQRARADLVQANAELRGYAAQAEQLATTQERNRLARDIHDGLGHHLTVVQMQVQAARALLGDDPAAADAVLAKAQQQAIEALAEVRRSVAALRESRTLPPLPSALQALVADAGSAGVQAYLDIAGYARTLPDEAEEALFRAAQEGLTNVGKHAHSRSAQLVLDYRLQGCVQLEVRDDGLGAEVADGANTGPGFGILGLRERAAGLGGTLEVRSTPGEGTVLRMALPG